MVWIPKERWTLCTSEKRECSQGTAWSTTACKPKTGAGLRDSTSIAVQTRALYLQSSLLLLKCWSSSQQPTRVFRSASSPAQIAVVESELQLKCCYSAPQGLLRWKTMAQEIQSPADPVLAAFLLCVFDPRKQEWPGKILVRSPSDCTKEFLFCWYLESQRHSKLWWSIIKSNCLWSLVPS